VAKNNKMEKIKQAKQDIINSFIRQQAPITRDNLMSCIAQNNMAYENGSISYSVRVLLDTAVIEIWNETFKTDISVNDIIRSN